ncbi:hypothetical protein [Acinetobacter baumannii]|uniref:hypothetical protein n=1 Tax=Acinetobacter baumannii TaxID=470 RepID=UPI000CE37A03|nr:hypothetical protein [Acinetobacter baumannii]PPB90511.1 hypothetical protein AbaMCR9238_10755 [Acinetobacter baumannii]PPC11931.1 hypothetical protein AbaMCR10126_07540 [Acinetobacter baumannii]PPC15369.1 hypothetical protein AbaMCR10172_13050 [Acinetobacter baumannii]
MIKFLSVVFLSTLLFGCSSSNDAVKALKANGFIDIQTHGHAFFNCSKDDTFATKFTAKNKDGQKVKGAVCSGWLKGATIRYD